MEKGSEMADSPNDFKLQGLILEEFRHAGNLSNQVRQERTSLYSVFVVTTAAATTVGVYLFSQWREQQPVAGSRPGEFRIELTWALIIALALAGLFGVSIFVRLRALGKDYASALRTMAGLEDFYVSRLNTGTSEGVEDDAAAAVWRTDSARILRTIPFGGVVTLAVIGAVNSIAFGLSGMFLAFLAVALLPLPHLPDLVVALPGLVVSGVFHGVAIAPLVRNGQGRSNKSRSVRT
jgi:hypothetical protein